ncbi:bifunctional UDP-sugar hydrolase/5'-nucleotidase periplasmic [Actinobacillus equuli]|nr:bifunctional UDP-sugar hydrolase/5'-nucleotidase periplasmic [Actinobacillus equuli]
MKFNKTLLSVALLSATSAMAYQTDKTYSFTLLHTNDIHGHFWQNDKGEYGLAAQKTLIDNIKKKLKPKAAQQLS